MVALAGRTMTVIHAGTEQSMYGDIQHYRITMSGSECETDYWTMQKSSAADAWVLASIIDTELLLACDGSRESGVLRDPHILEWRDQHRNTIAAKHLTLQREGEKLPPAWSGEESRRLLGQIGFGDGGFDE